MGITIILAFAALVQFPPKPLGPAEGKPENRQSLEKSGYFAFVDREFIFTLEMVKPGIPLVNFISMSDKETPLMANEIRLTLESRKVPGKFFLVDTGDPKQPVMAPSIKVRPRSSFGMRLQGDFDESKEPFGVTIRFGTDEFKLVALTSFDFENLALKINKINLGSPDFSDDWNILKLEKFGTREPARRSR